MQLLDEELHRQKEGLELIASENFVSEAVMKATGSALTNKYAEGYPHKRYYGGCEVVDKVEDLAIERLKKAFDLEWANVQPHSGSQANLAVFVTCLKPGDKFLGFSLDHGGHLTHGSPANFSGKIYQALSYGVKKDDFLVDYDMLEKVAIEEKPKMIVCGASSYSRDWDYKRIRNIADKINAIVLADIAHTAGLIAKKLLNDPFEHCHIVTSTTHKTLRGPRGGIIMMRKDFDNPFGLKDKKGNLRSMGSLLNGAIFPGIQGGPLMHVIAAKAVAFGEVLDASFDKYAQQVIKNAKVLSSELLNYGHQILTGGTDNHLMSIDLRNTDITGKVAEEVLQSAKITVNKNMVPFDHRSPFVTSGIRLGTAALTTRGMKEEEMKIVASYIDKILKNISNDAVIKSVGTEIKDFTHKYPLFSTSF